MTAFTTPTVRGRSGSDRPFAGFRALVRKDVGEWTHGARPVVVAVLTSAFMGLAAANNWLNAWVIANVESAHKYQGVKEISLDPLGNLAGAVATQFFVFTLGSGWIALGAGTLAFGFAFTLFEVLVAFLQAYVFTILTAVYIQLAVAEEH